MQNKILVELTLWAQTAGYFIAALLFDYLKIPSEQITIFGALMVIDVFTGYLKCRKLDRSAFSSQKLSDGVIKKILVLTSIVALAFMAQGIHIQIEKFLEWSISILIVAETYSIIQNVYIHRTGKHVTEHDAITLVYKAFCALLLKLLKTLIKKLGSSI